MSISVRRLHTADDITDTLLMAEDFINDSRFAHMDMDHSTLLNTVLQIRDNGILLGAFYKDALIGVMAIGVYQSKFSRECMAFDEMFYVHPTYRGSSVARKLVLNAVALCAADARIKRITFGNLGMKPEQDSEPWERVLVSCGFIRSGLIYSMEI